MRYLAYISILAWCISPVLGNVEKTIFIAPEPIDYHTLRQQPNLDTLKLEVLNPSNLTLRRQLSPAKPGSQSGNEAWFLLDRLKHRRRYEVRICWLATVRYHLISPQRKIFFFSQGL